MEEPIFRHPALDFASIHIYQGGTIDAPQNTVDPAIAMGDIVVCSLAEIGDGRPFFDSEHGPIHSFKDRHITLPEPFDDEYFWHMSWAHLASGGAGGGMRWPNRRPHVLTRGMRDAEGAMARFMPHIDWLRFDRRNSSGSLKLTDAGGLVGPNRLARFGCQTDDQALVYMLRRDALHATVVRRDPPIEGLRLREGARLDAGRHRVVHWCTSTGATLREDDMDRLDDGIALPPLEADLAVAIRRWGGLRRITYRDPRLFSRIRVSEAPGVIASVLDEVDDCRLPAALAARSRGGNSSVSSTVAPSRRRRGHRRRSRGCAGRWPITRPGYSRSWCIRMVP